MIRKLRKYQKNMVLRFRLLRSNKNSDDFATTFDVIKEVLEWYSNNENINIETACCIYATAPFITNDLLIKAEEKLTSNKFDTVFPVTRFGFPDSKGN